MNFSCSYLFPIRKHSLVACGSFIQPLRRSCNITTLFKLQAQKRSFFHCVGVHPTKYGHSWSVPYARLYLVLKSEVGTVEGPALARLCWRETRNGVCIGQAHGTHVNTKFIFSNPIYDPRVCASLDGTLFMSTSSD